ncbi:hypothetical protein N3K66_001759 [Trichothecium roseum]|uniref:Uncharacterized protein n=1 Tax=Trichothecium roseum TaxID=47278 RepID=A0ACC0V940_9HYPO|nr:hypothetical protein N3K66_001759 [Trichothecium roseum]
MSDHASGSNSRGPKHGRPGGGGGGGGKPANRRGFGSQRNKGKGKAQYQRGSGPRDGDRGAAATASNGRGGDDEDNGKRKADEDWRELKRRRTTKDGTEYVPDEKPNPFSQAEIEAEERRPKRKVAVMIGYAGTGYKGMQANRDEPTIERDLFRAFVAAGAISKANANDPKKSSLIRCARTDKGVHAAGNLISLKLIIEDEDVVRNINDNLPPQIRVWGIERTSNAFNCYHACDSRWYEYLMPSYCLLPPHPQSYLGKKVRDLAREHGYEATLDEKMADVKDWWSELDDKEIQPFLATLDPEIRNLVMQRMHVDEGWAQRVNEEAAEQNGKGVEEKEEGKEEEKDGSRENVGDEAAASAKVQNGQSPMDFALRDLKNIVVGAKRRYRISKERLDRLQDVLTRYEGTNNFHNFTINKSFRDPSAKRHIKSFVANPKPIIIGGTEWLSLKVHGQSFMMHQIRKMVGLASLVVRCGTDPARVRECYQEQKIAIPKAPSLGLLLERPVFDSYNYRAVDQLGRNRLDFSAYEAELEKFKQEQIYNRIFEVEDKDAQFNSFFTQIDQFKQNHFLWVTAGGREVAKLTAGGDQAAVDRQLGDEDEDPEGGEG